MLGAPATRGHCTPRERQPWASPPGFFHQVWLWPPELRVSSAFAEIELSGNSIWKRQQNQPTFFSTHRLHSVVEASLSTLDWDDSPVPRRQPSTNIHPCLCCSVSEGQRLDIWTGSTAAPGPVTDLANSGQDYRPISSSSQTNINKS